jgi:hypothetical protein
MREGIHGARDKNKRPGNARPPNIYEGRDKEVQRFSCEKPKVIAIMEQNHRDDRKPTYQIKGMDSITDNGLCGVFAMHKLLTRWI